MADIGTKYVRFMRGTIGAYEALSEDKKNSDTLYFLTDPNGGEGWLYLGTKLISGPGVQEINETLNLTDLKDVFIDSNLNTDAFLIFNTKSGQWEARDFSALTFQGASSTIAGLSGLVPAPSKGAHNQFLRGDGTWADAGASNLVFEVVPQANETHMQAISRITGGTLLNTGDITIVKDYIATDSQNHAKYQYTAYVCNAIDSNYREWVAMDGNYNAENVYFKNNLIFTTEVGSVKIPASGRATVATEGKNLKQVMELIFAQEKLLPDVTPPKVVLETPENKAYEVGTKVIPTYKVALDPGQYEFGPDTGVSAVNYSIMSSYSDQPVSEIEGQFDEITVEDNTQYYITATITHTGGTQPVTNLNNICEEQQIQAGNVTTTSPAITGYRSFFYGMDNTGNPLSGNFIRENLINGGIYDDQKKFIFDASECANVKRFIIAIPADSERSGLISARITSSMYANVIEEYKELQYGLTIGGVNNYKPTAYKVWIYEPASIAENEIHEIILS